MKEIDYRIGLDIGTNSVGWSIIRLEFNEDIGTYEKVGIEKLGVRMFDRAEVPKTGESLAAPRRLARSSRRRLSRKSKRKQQIRELLVKHNVISRTELDQLYPLKRGALDVWDIRLDALERRLNPEEWARLLIHLAQRRGFKSNRKADQKDKETGRVLESIQDNQKVLSKYRTVGEMWRNDPKFTSVGRYRNSTDEFIFNVSRDDLEQEIKTLFEAQRNFMSENATVDLEQEYLSIWNHQLPFASGNSILKMVGYCSLEADERRIPKATFTFQYFAALDKINNIRLIPNYEPLTPEQRTSILKEMFNRTDYFNRKTIPKITYANLRKWASIDADLKFNGLDYGTNNDIKKAEKKEFINLKPFYEINKIIRVFEEETGQEFSHSDIDSIGYALTVYKNDRDIRLYLQHPNNIAKRAYDESLIEELLLLSYSKFGHLSKKALKRLIPVMETGLTFKQAADQLDYDTTGLKKSKKSNLLPIIPDDITNPIVKRALTQARKVVNAIIKRYGPPVAVNIEMARELSKDIKERRKILNEQEGNRKRNKGAIKVLNDFGIKNPTGYDIVRYKLWTEQNETCAYSLKKIPAEIFFSELRRERGSVPTLDVDHILPYSQSFMDSYQNKVLVYSDENRKKGNRIPYDYLISKEGKWEEFKDYVETNKSFSSRKKDILLKVEFNPRESEIIKERHLNDTRYATRYFKNFIERTLIFKQTKIPIKKRVQTVNGRITSHLRSRWGLTKERENTHLHHALDAVVVACTDQMMINKVTEYHKYKENSQKRKSVYFPLPWENFRDELLTKLSLLPVPEEINRSLINKKPLPDYILVSRKARRSVTGAAHKDTIMMDGGIDERTGNSIIIKRVALGDISFDKNGDFKMVGKDTDPATYQAIKSRYLEYDGDKVKAFAEPLYKPSKKGIGNEIKRVKVEVGRRSFVRKVNGGLVNNGDLVRVDIFTKGERYFMVPIYVLDTVEKVLPMKAVTARKGHDHWTEVDETFEFQFSIHPYELVRVQKDDIDRFYYFATLDIDGNRLEFVDTNIPSKSTDHRFTISTIKKLEKYHIDILGNLTLIQNETRQNFQQRDRVKVTN